MIYLTLIALATLIYAGAWMCVAPSKALTAVNRISNEISRFDQTTLSFGMEPMRESAAIRVAFRFAGLALIFLSVIRLIQIT
jgi:hypothetical protein